MALNMARISVGSARRPAPEDATRELEYLKQLASMHHIAAGNLRRLRYGLGVRDLLFNNAQH